MKLKQTTIYLSILGLMVLYACVPSKSIKEVNKNLPDTYTSNSYNEDSALSSDTSSSAQINYKDFFKNEQLIKLIDTALSNNQELLISLQRIKMFESEIKAKKGEYLPFVNYGVQADLDKVGQYTRNGAVEENLNIKEDQGFPEPLPNYGLGITASWELDIWKKLRNSKKAATLEYLASIEGRNFMITQLVAEVATSFYELRALDNKLVILNKNLELQKNALRMIKIQKEAAKANQLAVTRFEAEVAKNQSELFDINQRISQLENKINFLLGRKPQPISRSSEMLFKEDNLLVYEGIPAQLLSNRPDLRQAELELKAAELDSKIAKANFYPSFGIRGGVGLESFNPKFLTSLPESLIYGLSADLVGPLINKNAIKAEYNRANAKQLKTIYEYEKTILKAYMEVANELSQAINLNKRFKKKFSQVEYLRSSIELSNLLFKSARIEYIEVLLTQREALEAETELVDTRKEQLINQVRLYKSLGGGWL